jgi:excinuclease UvrABC nuclease subunit
MNRRKKKAYALIAAVAMGSQLGPPILDLGYRYTLTTGAIATIGVAGLLAYLHRDDDREGGDLDELHELHELYVTGEIEEAELERRLETRIDPEADRIREAIEPIPGVGPITSREVAARFDSLAQLERADRDDLENVPGVGPDRAEAIRDRLR